VILFIDIIAAMVVVITSVAVAFQESVTKTSFIMVNYLPRFFGQIIVASIILDKAITYKYLENL